MPPPRRETTPIDWTTPELMLMLLRQFRNLLAERGAEYDDLTLRELTDNPVLLEAERDRLIQTMSAIVDESVAFLGGWNLSYSQSLATDMNDLAHLWETTAEFLDVANQKNNAELRINGGSALLGLLGVVDHVPYLLATIDYDLTHYRDFDIDGTIARYTLCQLSGVAVDAADWLGKVRKWAGDLNV